GRPVKMPPTTLFSAPTAAAPGTPPPKPPDAPAPAPGDLRDVSAYTSPELPGLPPAGIPAGVISSARCAILASPRGNFRVLIGVNRCDKWTSRQRRAVFAPR